MRVPSSATHAQFSGVLSTNTFWPDQIHQVPTPSTKMLSDDFVRQSTKKTVLFGNADPFQQKIEDAIFIVIDTETTGYSSKTGCIIQISAKKYQNGKCIGEYTTFVNPGEQRIPPNITELTKIQQTDVADAPTLTEVIPELTAFLGENPFIVAHNASFDLNFLHAAYDETVKNDRSNGSVDKNTYETLFSPRQVFCTYAFAQGVFSEKKCSITTSGGESVWGYPSGTLKLGTIAQSFGISDEGAHQADFDVQMCAIIFYKMVQRLRDNGIPMSTVQDLRDYLDALPSKPAWETHKNAVA